MGMKSQYDSRCFVYYGPGELRLENWKLECGPREIMLRIDVCGRCGTDRRLYDHPHPAVQTPTILGHELVGQVVEVGREVRNLTEGVGYRQGQTLTTEQLCPSLGQRVTVQSRIARHANGLMLMRDPIENLSFCMPGAYAQYMRVTETMIRAGTVLPVPDDVEDEQAALVEPTACALESIFATPHAVGVDDEGRHRVHSGILPDGRTLIIGSGTLALVYAQLARLENASEVWLMVRSEAKATLAREVLGDWVRVKVVPDYSELPLPDKLQHESKLQDEFADATDGFLLDDVILACPSIDAQRLMFRLLNPDGYAVAVSFAGLHLPSDHAEVDLLHYRMGKASGTSGCSTRTMETVLQWLAQKKLSLKDFTCPHHYTLNDDPDEFFQTKADGRKPMLYPWE